jgi:MinD-like ATPase involved in chromosome partitioning or flagellar assembly
MPEFKYDFSGLDVHGVIIVREQIRKKLIDLSPNSKAAPEFQELDAALGEYFYQEEKKMVEHQNGKEK